MRRLAAALLFLSVACLDETAEVGQRAAGLTPVTWTDVVGASAVDNDLTKTAPQTAWNAGAVSIESLRGDGFVEFTTGEATTTKMAGLSNGNGGPDDADIDFAVWMGASGAVAVFEGGVNRGNVGSYAAGDAFRVQVAGGVVTYWQNGSLLYTSVGAPAFPLLVDTSLRTPGATLNDAVVVSQSFWEEVVGASEAGSDLVKTAPDNTWSAGAVSAASLTGDGFMEFTTGESTTAKMAGLSSGNDGEDRADIDFGIQLSAGGVVSIQEGGVMVGGFGPYAAGDRFRVEVEGGVVTYWRNGGLLHTSASAPSFPLRVDTSLRTPGATVNDVVIQSLVFWENVVNAQANRNDLVKTSAQAGWNAGATSIQSIASGDCYVQFTTGETDAAKMAGLSNGNGGQGFSDIDFAIYMSSNGGIDTYEQGVDIDNHGPFAAGDVFQVRVTGGVVSYWRNGFQYEISTATPTYPLLFDTSLRTPGASILDAVIGSGAPPECTPVEQSFLGTAAGERFGARFDVEGDVLVVVDFDSDTTVANVYRRGSNGWAFEQALPTATAGTARAVATDGERIAALVQPVGATQFVGRVYRHDGVQWVPEADFQPCPEDGVGFSAVAVRGDLLVLAVRESIVDGVPPMGRLYVHRRDAAGAWPLEGILTHTELSTREFDRVAVAGGWIAGGNHQGALHLFRYSAGLPDPSQPPSCANIDPGKWRYRQTMDPAGAFDLSPSGRRLVLHSLPNAVYVYEREGATWSQTAQLVPYPPDAPVGRSLALGGPDPDNRAVIAGGGRVFAEDESGGWRQIDVLPTPVLEDSRGVTADQIFVGDQFDDSAGTDAGAIRVDAIEAACFPE